jgi:nicotinamidase-related amidase
MRMTIKGTAGCEIASDLAIAPSDPVVIENSCSPFQGTDPDQLAHRVNPDALVLAGINPHACIRVTAIDAYQRDWEVVVAADCVDSYDRQQHDVQGSA